MSAALVAGCGGSEPPIGASGVTSQTPAVQARVNVAYEILYSFGAHGDDGGYPRAGLINSKGRLYGTTIGGGANCIPSGGCGTVYTIEHFGGEKVIHSFGAAGDGSEPYATLIPVGGRLYGTTYDGGANGDGTVFAITHSGRETVLYSFKGSSASDGANPYASLISVNGRLYGTTYFGGANQNQGTAFAIGPYGGETVIHSFYAYSGDGTQPIAGLLNIKDRLYGTTYFGGANHNGGTFFSLTRSGKETVLYSFGGGKTDGANPYAALVNVRGTLYGTTEHGGGSGCYYGGCGTVFAIGPYGGETVIHSFGGSGDGKYPRASLVYIKGTLYGTTTNGGANCIQSGGCGTVFSIKLSGKETETVLHSFGDGSGDGVTPYAGLLNINGTLYGTTAGGGTYNEGTVFSLKP